MSKETLIEALKLAHRTDFNIEADPQFKFIPEKPKAKVYHSSKTDEWATPHELFWSLNKLYNFTLDPCATPLNAKCEKFYTKKDNGLLQDWTGERLFINPPYSELAKWLAKAKEHDAVCLVPARTDTRAFHDHVFGHGEVEFIKGRLKFGDSKNSAPFPSCLIYYGKLKKRENK